MCCCYFLGGRWFQPQNKIGESLNLHKQCTKMTGERNMFVKMASSYSRMFWSGNAKNVRNHISFSFEKKNKMGGVEVDLDFGIWFDWRLLCWRGSLGKRRYNGTDHIHKSCGIGKLCLTWLLSFHHLSGRYLLCDQNQAKGWRTPTSMLDNTSHMMDLGFQL